MDLKDAFEIVLDLAAGNIISEEEASQDPEILKPERKKQYAALQRVQLHYEELLVNDS